MSLKYSNEKNVLLLLALLKAHGVRKVVASPGTTNITLVGSMMHDPFFQIYSSVDERSAAYIACGMAEESGEPVIICCTGATASRNYFSGLTEAYYRKLPILAITATREECKVGHLIDQQIDRTLQPRDTVHCSEHLQIIKDDEDWWNCTIKINRVLLSLKSNGGGPAHLNFPTLYSKRFDVDKLPQVRKIERYQLYEEFPEISDKRDVAIFIGSHKRMTVLEERQIERFCELYNAVVFCDITCGYHGKYGITMSANKRPQVDLLIHLGEVSCVAYGCKPNEVWRVSEDGELRDTFRKLTKVFAMPDVEFFKHYTCEKSGKDVSKYKEYKEYEDFIYSKLKEVPFSNGWIAQYLHDKLPMNSVVHLGIVSSFFAWNRFKLDPSINITCNQGGFGIDGNISTLMGQALIHPEKIYYCFIGDLAFFYDMNVLGNRHFPNNIRILLVNNGKGVIFRKPTNIGSVFGEEADLFLAAGGHFGNMNHELVKSFVTNLGFTYLSAKDKESFMNNINSFISPELLANPIVLECFVSTENEIAGDNLLREQGLKGIVNGLLGDDLYDGLKRIATNITKGNMGVDAGRN